MILVLVYRLPMLIDILLVLQLKLVLLRIVYSISCFMLPENFSDGGAGVLGL